MTQVPGRSCGASPPATPKLIIPGQFPNSVRASAIAAPSVAVKLRPLPPQMTYLPGPAAMRASKANPTTMIKSPQRPILRIRIIQRYPERRQNYYHSRHRLITISYFRLDEATLSQGGRNAFAPRRPSGSCWQICHALAESHLCECWRASRLSAAAKNCEINWRDSTGRSAEGG